MVKVAYPLASSQVKTPQDWSNMAQNWIGTGVIKGKLNELSVYGDSTGMQIKCKSGQAFLQGHFFQSDAEVILPIATANATNPRIDRIIIRLDYTSDSIDFAVLQGIPAVSPVTPALTQNSTRWEISLAQVYMGANVSTIAAGNITDERIFTGNLSTAWAPLTLQNGWVNEGSGNFGNASYRINKNGNLELKGRIKNGTNTTGTVIATLPNGFKPPKNSGLIVACHNGSNVGSGEIDVNADGTIIVAAVSNYYVSLDGINIPLS